VPVLVTLQNLDQRLICQLGWQGDTHMHNLQWSKAEKQIARAAYDRALARECTQIIARVRAQAGTIS
jgi:hypothetical protein